MASIFTGIYNLMPPARSMRKAKRKLERAAANRAIADIQSQIEHRKAEEPRERAFLKQSMFGRGLGKSSIFSQDKERQERIQRQTREALDRAMHVAIRYRQYIKKKQRYERRLYYAEMADTIVSVAMSIAGVPSMPQGGSAPGAPSMGPNYGSPYAGYMDAGLA